MPDQVRKVWGSGSPLASSAPSPVSRRTAAFALAGVVVGAKLASSPSVSMGPQAAPNPGAPDAPTASTEPRAALPPERALLAPLAEGSRLLSWEVVAIEPLQMGAVKVALSGESGVAFGIEVLARDTSPLASAPPAVTGKFALYVNNGGDGRMPTVEEQGLAAMALAQLVARNEGAVSAEGFLTHAERIAEHRVALLEHVPEEPPRPEPVSRVRSRSTLA